MDFQQRSRSFGEHTRPAMPSSSSSERRGSDSALHRPRGGGPSPTQVRGRTERAYSAQRRAPTGRTEVAYRKRGIEAHPLFSKLASRDEARGILENLFGELQLPINTFLLRHSTGDDPKAYTLQCMLRNREGVVETFKAKVIEEDATKECVLLLADQPELTFDNIDEVIRALRPQDVLPLRANDTLVSAFARYIHKTPEELRRQMRVINRNVRPECFASSNNGGIDVFLRLFYRLLVNPFDSHSSSPRLPAGFRATARPGSGAVGGCSFVKTHCWGDSTDDDADACLGVPSGVGASSPQQIRRANHWQQQHDQTTLYGSTDEWTSSPHDSVISDSGMPAANVVLPPAVDLPDFWPETEHLRVLVVTCNARMFTGMPIDVDQEGRDIIRAAKSSKLRQRIRLRVIPLRAREDLAGELDEFSPHFVHFCGHSTEAGIELMHPNEPGVELVSSEELAEILMSTLQQPAALVLNCCNSGHVARTVMQLAGTGDDGVLWAAIGSDAETDDDQSMRFAATFWGRVFEGCSFERALSIANANITAHPRNTGSEGVDTEQGGETDGPDAEEGEASNASPPETTQTLSRPRFQMYCAHSFDADFMDDVLPK